MRRTPEVIDVWFDSGAMPFAQWHYPFENREAFEAHFPADFISEAVDQTRGWFYSLLAISTLLFDKPAYKNCVVMELVLDREGQKMSKSKGNVVDPWQVIDEVGIDPLRWYMLSASQPWIPLKFDLEGPREVSRKLFSTLANTYSFFALYANVDGVPREWLTVRTSELSLSDRWLLSRVQTLSAQVDRLFETYDLTRALRSISGFVQDELSNWYVRRSRRRFWVSASGPDKRAAFYTLYQALLTTARLLAPAAPFTAERLYRDLVGYAQPEAPPSVHLTSFPQADSSQMDTALETAMALAMEAVSLGRAARAQVGLKVRQPVARLVVVTPSSQQVAALSTLSDLVADEVNAKSVHFTSETSDLQILRVKPLFPKLGPPFGKKVNEVAGLLKQLTPAEALRFKAAGVWHLHVDGHEREVSSDLVEFLSEARPGWALASEGGLTVAVDTNLSEALLLEGLARELVNRIQNMRKEAGFAVTDRIVLDLDGPEQVLRAFEQEKDYILQETLTVHVTRSGQAGELQKCWPLAGGEAKLSVARTRANEQGTR
jgi:isoleucyl-tRNA synthetase